MSLQYVGLNRKIPQVVNGKLIYSTSLFPSSPANFTTTHIGLLSIVLLLGPLLLKRRSPANNPGGDRFRSMSTLQKTFLLLSCTFLGLICGTLYLYSSFSPQLASRLHYTVSDSSKIALTGTLGMATAGPLAGLAVDRTGYSLPFICGGLSIVIGYWGLKHQYDTAHSNFFLTAFLLYIIGAGSTFTSFPSVKCCAMTFPKIKGLATSLPLATFGLSAMFFSMTSSVFYPGDTSGVLSLICILSLCIFLLCAPSIIRSDFHRPGALLPTQQSSFRELELSPISTPPTKPRKQPVSKGSGYDHIDDPLACNLCGIHLLKNKAFWALFFITGTLAATGQMYIYSVGYISKALFTRLVSNSIQPDTLLTDALHPFEGQIQVNQQLQVGTISLANSLGRILAGILSDTLVKSFRKQRVLLLYVPSLMMILAQLMGVRAILPEHLTVNSVLTGMAYGMTFGAMPVIVGETFGMENFSSNWGIVSLAPIAPGFFLTSAFGRIYDSHTLQYPTTSIGGNVSLCVIGEKCYESAFKMTLGVTLATFEVVLYLNTPVSHAAENTAQNTIELTSAHISE